MKKELEELKQQLEIWIDRTNPELSDEGKDKWETIGQLSTLLIVKDWVDNKLKSKLK